MDFRESNKKAEEFTDNQVSPLARSTEFLIWMGDLVSQIKNVPLDRISFEDPMIYDSLRQWQMQGSFFSSAIDKEVRASQSKLTKAFNKQEGINHD